jgi:hypothetical protein
MYYWKFQTTFFKNNECFFFGVRLMISYHPNVLDYQQVCMKKIKGPLQNDYEHMWKHKHTWVLHWTSMYFNST